MKFSSKPFGQYFDLGNISRKSSIAEAVRVVCDDSKIGLYAVKCGEK